MRCAGWIGAFRRKDDNAGEKISLRQNRRRWARLFEQYWLAV